MENSRLNIISDSFFFFVHISSIFLCKYIYICSVYIHGDHIFKYLTFFVPLKYYPMTIQSYVFQIGTPPFLLLIIQQILFSENFYVPKSKFKRVVFEINNFVICLW